MKNGYPGHLIGKGFKTETNRIMSWKMSSSSDFVFCRWEIDLDQKKHKEDDEKVYRAAKPRVIFTSSSVLSPKGKDLISNKEKIAWFTRLNVVAQTVI